MTGVIPRCISRSINLSASYALSARIVIRVDVFQKRFRLGDIGILSRCDAEFRRITQSVADGMDL
ncbi:hypothetical protein HK16_06250 [Acetobacter senegalensis]|uniref:Uncharacterized protein n=1 Tax=Acetobacter senegalensis TaxID=446692 RepID=A0A252EE02_9PROT|nr:hypothetical protein HK16_06250 [Acetobacter senegalensis]